MAATLIFLMKINHFNRLFEQVDYFKLDLYIDECHTNFTTQSVKQF